MTLAFIEGWIIYPAVCGDMRGLLPVFPVQDHRRGDIKLMGVVTGFLGVWDGMLVIGLEWSLLPQRRLTG